MSQQISQAPWADFGATPLQGRYWVRGVRSETDDDTDEQGHAVRWLTSQQTDFEALVEIDFDPAPGGRLSVTAVDAGRTGDYDHFTDMIAHVRPAQGGDS